MSGTNTKSRLEEDVKRIWNEKEELRQELEHYKKVRILPGTLDLIEQRVNNLRSALSVAISLIPPTVERKDTIEQLKRISMQ